MCVHHLDLALEQKLSQTTEPADIRRALGIQAGHLDARGLEIRQQGVLLRRQIGDFVREVETIPLAYLGSQKELCPATAESLDHTKYSDGPRARSPRALPGHYVRYPSRGRIPTG